MAGTAVDPNNGPALLYQARSIGEFSEMTALGLLPGGEPVARSAHIARRAAVPRRAIHARDLLNEAVDYARPSSFSRGIAVDVGDKTLILISGTASVDEAGLTVHPGDFRAQLWRTYRNITALLSAEGAAWPDVVRTTCYLRDIERDYRDFNEVRTAFFTWLRLDPLPASTAIQARLCREDLLVEIEAMALVARMGPRKLP